MILHPYYSSSGRNLIYDYIDSLPVKEQVDGYTVLQPWEKKIYEVYFQKHNRIFYIMKDKENIYLLHACRKQKNKTEKKDAHIVRKRAKELNKMLGKKFI